jgi:hypothetical protein
MRGAGSSGARFEHITHARGSPWLTLHAWWIWVRCFNSGPALADRRSSPSGRRSERARPGRRRAARRPDRRPEAPREGGTRWWSPPRWMVTAGQYHARPCHPHPRAGRTGSASSGPHTHPSGPRSATYASRNVTGMQRVGYPPMPELPLRADFVDGRGRHAEQLRNLSHGQEPLRRPAHGGGSGYQGGTKRRANPCQPRRTRAACTGASAWTSGYLRIVATPCQLTGTACHAGAQGSSPPTPRHFRGRDPATGSRPWCF